MTRLIALVLILLATAPSLANTTHENLRITLTTALTQFDNNVVVYCFPMHDRIPVECPLILESMALIYQERQQNRIE